MTPTWVSQRVPPMGAIKAEAIKNQLGRPTLDRLDAAAVVDACRHQRMAPMLAELERCLPVRA